MRVKMLIICIVVFCCEVLAQSHGLEKNFYESASIELQDTSLDYVTNLRVCDDSLTYFDVSTMTNSKVAIEDVYSLQVEDGSYILEGALLGGIIGAGISVFAIQVTGPHDNSITYNPNDIVQSFGAGSIILLSTVLSMSIGAMIGKSSSKYRSYTFSKANETIGLLNTDIGLGNSYLGTNYLEFKLTMTF